MAHTLAARLATLPRQGGCGIYATESLMVGGVLQGGGCCSDFVKTFILLAGELGIAAREVHIPRHTTAEYWDSAQQRWIWIDPFIGYQAFSELEDGSSLSHLDVYQHFLNGNSVSFRLIESPWPMPIEPTPGYQGHLPSQYQFIFYTPEDSWRRSAPLSDWLGQLGIPKPIKELALYLTVKPRLLVTGVEQNFFLLQTWRLLAVVGFLAWIGLNVATLMAVQLLLGSRNNKIKPIIVD